MERPIEFMEQTGSLTRLRASHLLDSRREGLNGYRAEVFEFGGREPDHTGNTGNVRLIGRRPLTSQQERWQGHWGFLRPGRPNRSTAQPSQRGKGTLRLAGDPCRIRDADALKFRFQQGERYPAHIEARALATLAVGGKHYVMMVCSKQTGRVERRDKHERLSLPFGPPECTLAP